ncbi:MAG: DUF484 family protein [Candidatus Pacebacteria bacterium]|nr:DUF484 family protein [Candidatus Paceibacterota bacterium]
MDKKPTHLTELNPSVSPDSPPGLSAAMVLGWLENNPELIANEPKFASLLALAERDLGDGVVDFQHRRLEKLQETILDLQQQNRKIIATVRQNYQIQNRVHQAVLALVKASSFERLIALITMELSGILGLEALSLCVEAGAKGLSSIPLSPFSQVRLVETGTIPELLEGNPILLRAEVFGDSLIYGANAERVRSDALLQLDFGAAAPVGMLALGARRPGIFYPGQNTELLEFFSEVLVRSLRHRLSALND